MVTPQVTQKPTCSPGGVVITRGNAKPHLFTQGNDDSAGDTKSHPLTRGDGDSAVDAKPSTHPLTRVENAKVAVPHKLRNVSLEHFEK